MPSPPICIKHKITHFPNKLQYVAVFLTTRPVTHVADVDVNKASLKDVAFPFACEIGSISSSVPKSIRHKKPRIIIWKDVNLTFFKKPPQHSLKFILPQKSPAILTNSRAAKVLIVLSKKPRNLFQCLKCFPIFNVADRHCQFIFKIIRELSVI